MNNNSLTDFLKVQNKLKLLGQQPVLNLFSSLLDEQQTALIEQVQSLDVEAFFKQRELFETPYSHIQNTTPFNDLILSGCEKKKKRGQEAISEGKCAALLIAGGQGTRLGHQGPKGTYPISPIYHKSLFQIFCEKVLKASKLYQKDLPLVIMTSPLNDSLTRRYLREHNYFGLKQEQVHFFTQTMLPFLDLEKNLFLEDKNSLACGPDGNGSCFKQLVQQKVADHLSQLGIQYINFILVDNPLADPYDEELFGQLIDSESEVTLKTCQRLSPREKVGVIMEKDSKPIVVEYHELDDSIVFDTEPAANLSLMAMTLEFAQRCASIELPLHKAKKPAAYFDIESQKMKYPKVANCWKFETYLFDVLPFSNKTTVMSYPRERIFCPLKNKEGDFGPNYVKKSLTLLGID